ncbi:hypothetical protein M0812_03090 [Anaeramoeba flamelloides]|uniref:Phosphatidic acid phosphatase type 2/haloperoxidase domain-containing protein n=1 Tax=Anaeramoeba flamelloides TaxID=1746091 RepID=A0AAV7YVH7_9EUKA|nr:hypothetical protein M0812_03090 [Anaeramoeba flamelloides]
MKTSFFALLLIIFFLPHVLSIKPSCKNEINDNFFNKCRKQIPLGGGTVFGLTSNNFFGPGATGTGCLLVLLIFPFWYFGTHGTIKVTRQQLIKFHQMRFLLINLLHRTCYALLFCVTVYEMFRQSRPCKCDIYGTGVFTHFGSQYGMVSGDCMFGGLIAWFIIDRKPFGKLPSWIIGILVIIVKILERLLLGYHSIGQTISGATLGTVLYFYSTRTPQFLPFVDNFIMITLTPILVRIDPASKYRIADDNNMFEWAMWGSSYAIFESILNYRLFSKIIGLKNYKKSYTSIIKVFDKMLGNTKNVDSDDNDIQAHLLSSTSESSSQRSSNDERETESITEKPTKTKKENTEDGFQMDSEIAKNFVKKFSNNTETVNILKCGDVWATLGAFFVACVVMYIGFSWEIYAWR